MGEVSRSGRLIRRLGCCGLALKEMEAGDAERSAFVAQLFQGGAG